MIAPQDDDVFVRDHLIVGSSGASLPLVTSERRQVVS
jgi:hypothetical protein